MAVSAERERIGRFRLVQKVGQGGMAVVYRAVDEKLGRTVALKVLRPDRVGDGANRNRLLREARAAAAITHPNIAAVYEIDEAEGQIYLAMEWVEGRNLREAIEGKPMPVDEAVRLAIGMVKGLSRAHAAGVVHRDLKPDNVRVTPEGEVKILDFGLAKATGTDEDDGSTLTESGVILGTPPYMSPEQARGREIDGRSDLFSFGALLFEMLTGRRAFAGSTSVDVIDAVLNRPPVFAGADQVPPSLARIVRKCVEKDRALRYASAEELLADLRAEAGESAPSRSGVRAPAAPGWKVRLVVLLTALAAAVAIFVWRMSRTDESRRLRPSAGVEPSTQPSLLRITRAVVESPIEIAALSPDGRYVAHDDAEKGAQLIVIATGETVPLRPPPGRVRHLAWFPDGTRLIAVLEESRPGGPAFACWSLSILGTAPALLPIEGPFRYPAVSPDGRWLAGDAADGLVIFDLDSWRRRVLIASPDRDTWFYNLAWSPDGARIAYVKYDWTRPDDRMSIASVDVAGGTEVIHVADRIIDDGFGGGALAWLPDGRLLFPVRVHGSRMPGRAGLFTLAIDAAGRSVGEPALLVNLTESSAQELHASADGRRIAFVRAEVQSDVMIGDVAAVPFAPRRLTLNDDVDRLVDWLDEDHVLLHSRRNQRWGLYRQALDEREAIFLRPWPEDRRASVLAPDRRSVFYAERAPTGKMVLRRAPLDGTDDVDLAEFDDAAKVSVDCGAGPAARCLVGVLRSDGVTFLSLAGNVVQAPLGPFPAQRPEFAWALSDANDRLVFVDEDGALRFLDPSGRQVHRQANGLGCPIQDLAFAPDGRSVYTACWNGRGYLGLTGWKGGTTVLLDPPHAWVRDPSPSPGGKHLAYWQKNRDTDIWLIELP